MAAGVNVCLGSDGACSNNKLDMFQEMRAAAYLAKLRDLNPQALSAATVLKMAGKNGAHALGFADCGEIAPGKKADIILLSLNAPHLNPLHNLLSNLVYAACGFDVESVMVNGKWLMRKREVLTLDEEKIIFNANKAKKELFALGDG
jgi:5-methylthioadenosine/S-adenosylhomocysteine deaminase